MLSRPSQILNLLSLSIPILPSHHLHRLPHLHGDAASLTPQMPLQIAQAYHPQMTKRSYSLQMKLPRRPQSVLQLIVRVRRRLLYLQRPHVRLHLRRSVHSI